MPAPASQAAPVAEAPPAAPPVENRAVENRPEAREATPDAPEPARAETPVAPEPTVGDAPDDADTSPETAPAETAKDEPLPDQPGETDDAAAAPEKSSDGSPVTMDAIEEEMARLLSEISGTRK